MNTTSDSRNFLTFLTLFVAVIMILALSAGPSSLTQNTAFAASEAHDHADGSWTAFTESADHTLGAGKYYLTENVKLTG